VRRYLCHLSGVGCCPQTIGVEHVVVCLLVEAWSRQVAGASI
jgi:hypothetical protein